MMLKKKLMFIRVAFSWKGVKQPVIQKIENKWPEKIHFLPVAALCILFSYCPRYKTNLGQTKYEQGLVNDSHQIFIQTAYNWQLCPSNL